MKLSRINNKQLLFDLISLIAGCIYVIISSIFTRAFFVPMRPDIGVEQVAYKFLSTGANLSEDNISRIIVFVYSHILAVVIISVALMLFWRLLIYFVENNKERIKILVLGIVFILLMYCACCTYPFSIALSMDTFENYMWAKAWLPRQWHGFLTNIVYCAEFLIIPHPVSMILFPAATSFGLILYTIYRVLIKRAKYGLIFGLIWLASLFLWLPMIETTVFAGRNYMYGISIFAFVSVLFIDWIEKGELTCRKALWLAVFGAVAMTWRGEGMIWLAFFPLMIIATYFKKKPKIKTWLVCFVGLLLFFAVLWAPSKYLTEKYQGKDYLIINTGSSLGAVFNDPGSNLTYSGAQDDLENVDNVLPIEWIKAYGEMSFQFWNSYNVRITSQGGPNNNSDAYIKSAYSILFHNPVIFLKERLYVMQNALGLPHLYEITTATGEEIQRETSQEEDDLLLKWNEYRTEGYDEVVNTYALRDNPIRSKIMYYYQIISVKEGDYFGYAFIILGIIMLAVALWALIKKEWLFLLSSSAFLATTAAIILASPQGYSNYYFYGFFSEYWIMLFFVLEIIKRHSSERGKNYE